VAGRREMTFTGARNGSAWRTPCERARSWLDGLSRSGAIRAGV